MVRKPIHEHSYKYVLLRKFVDFYFHIFFRKVSIVGKENIPKGEPVLFALNHQCTLMDAFAVIFTLRSYQVFMARADIFKNPTAAKFLRFIKIIPLFRMRDGIKSLANNDQSFDDAVGTLLASERLVILPEGSHLGQKRLRSLKKGLARIAFQAEEKNDFKLGIKVIPVGLDYSDYIKFGSRLLVEYGKPFTMESYFDEYKENPQRAMNHFMEDLREHMIPMMHNVVDTDNYEGIKAACDLSISNLKSEKKTNSHYEERINAQKVTDALLQLKSENEERFNTIIIKANNIKSDLKKLNLRDWVLNKSKYNVCSIVIDRFLQFILLPFFLIGYLTNAIPFSIPVKLTKKVKDPLFFSSIRLASGAIFFTLYYLIILIVLLFCVHPFWMAFIIVSASGMLGILSFHYYRWFVKTSAKIRNNRLNRLKNETWMKMHADYKDLLEGIKPLV